MLYGETISVELQLDGRNTGWLEFMKNNVKDIDDDIDFSEEAFNKRFHRVSEDALPEPIRARRQAARRKLKNRVTIYLDSDIVSSFKDSAEKEDVGYQTLINNALRQIVDAKNRKAEQQSIKDDLLTDRKFLKKLREALEA